MHIDLPKTHKLIKKADRSQEELTEAGKEILYLVRPILSLKYGASLDSLKPIGTVRFSSGDVSRDLEKQLQELCKEQLNIDFSVDRHIPVQIPEQIVGSSSFFIFEVPE